MCGTPLAGTGPVNATGKETASQGLADASPSRLRREGEGERSLYSLVHGNDGSDDVNENEGHSDDDNDKDDSDDGNYNEDHSAGDNDNDNDSSDKCNRDTTNTIILIITMVVMVVIIMILVIITDEIMKINHDNKK